MEANSSISLARRNDLRQLLETSFGYSELRVLAFELGVDHETLNSTDKTAFAMDLILHFQRRGDLRSLVERTLHERPHLSELTNILAELPSDTNYLTTEIIIRDPRLISNREQFEMAQALLLASFGIEPMQFRIVAAAHQSLLILASTTSAIFSRLASAVGTTFGEESYRLESVKRFDELPKERKLTWQVAAFRPLFPLSDWSTLMIDKPIGKTSATERDAISSDQFTFWLTPDAIVNPFDIVMVNQVNLPGQFGDSKTYGLVTTLEHRTDAASHLSNFVSSNFGELDEEPNTIRQGTTVAFANVMSNTADIYMPVPSDKLTEFADKIGIEKALGIDVMDTNARVPAGLIKMSNGTSAVAYLDRDFLLGPEAGHVNISGISGLATKTSYAMFLIQAILQSAKDPTEIAVLILNVKGADLLQIDQRPDKQLPNDQMTLWEDVGLEPTAFKDVHYYVPNGRNGMPNCYLEPNMYTQYAYDLESAADKLDLLFTNVSDTSNTMESIIGDIMQGLESKSKDWVSVNSWKSLLHGPPLFDAKEGKTRGFGDNKVSSVGKFRRQLRRIVDTNQSGIFVEARAKHQRIIANEIANIKGGHTYVVDIAKLKDEEQTLVFGDLIRTVYQLVSEDSELRTVKDPVPKKIIFFVDELNKYAPSGGKESPITQQVLEIAERGRSLGVILISAQQFMSAVHSRVTGNSATKILGRTGSSEIMQPDYRFLDQDLKLSLTRLAKGELLISHAVYRQPVKVIFPRPAYKQSK